jgi:acetyl-CoA carboxylase biotin carboxylase subunit
VYAGWDVPVYYDSLLAKLCVWAETREAAIDRLARALGEYTVEGIHTTLPFFRAVVASSEFRAARLDTGFIDRFWSGESRESQGADDLKLADIAAIAALLHARITAPRGQTAAPALTSGSRWKLHGRLPLRRG